MRATFHHHGQLPHLSWAALRRQKADTSSLGEVLQNAHRVILRFSVSQQVAMIEKCHNIEHWPGPWSPS